MNPLKLKASVLKGISRELLARIQAGIERGKNFDSVFFASERPAKLEPLLLPKGPRGFAAIVNVIRSHVDAVPFGKDDLAELKRVLNQRVYKVISLNTSSERLNRSRLLKNPPWGKSRYPRFGDAESILADTPAERFAVEQLLRYLQMFQDEPRLVRLNPIGACSNCGALFLKTKSNQEVCCSKCRFAVWRVSKLKTDGQYFNRKARENRKSRKNLKRKKKV